jgi:hypothetical protein
MLPPPRLKPRTKPNIFVERRNPRQDVCHFSRSLFCFGCSLAPRDCAQRGGNLAFLTMKTLRIAAADRQSRDAGRQLVQLIPIAADRDCRHNRGAKRARSLRNWLALAAPNFKCGARGAINPLAPIQSRPRDGGRRIIDDNKQEQS